MALRRDDRVLTGDVVTRVIGTGGFSEVCIVESPAGKKVVKRLRDDVLGRLGSAAIDQFFRECQAWCDRLRGGPYVAQPHFAIPDATGPRGERLGPLLFVEYVDGCSLAQLCERAGRLSLSQTTRVGHQAAQALAYAHQQGVRHRDLKPSNILLNRRNEVNVIDWGLVGAFNALTPEYSSPERRNRPDLDDEKDDIYALGTVLYRCLTGELPGVVPRSSRVRERLLGAHELMPPRLAEAVGSMLSPSPTDRPTAAQVAVTLGELVVTNEVSKRETDWPFCPHCRYVALDVVSHCPVCSAAMHRRIPRPPREGMISVPAGAFIRGLREDQAKLVLKMSSMNAEQQHIEQLAPEPPENVFVPAFAIDEVPVTNEQFGRFCQACNYPEPKDFAAKKVAFPDHPVVDVTWKDAACYALWARKQLPTAVEWEKAARGGKDDRLYPWGNVWDSERCNNSRNLTARSTTPVHQFTSGQHDGRSPCGAADMAGNVREWILDGKQFGMRGLRGGGWADSPAAVHCLVTFQVDASVEDYHDETTGFRCGADIVYDEVEIGEEDSGVGRSESEGRGDPA